jgi:hypothetical protein
MVLIINFRITTPGHWLVKCLIANSYVAKAVPTFRFLKSALWQQLFLKQQESLSLNVSIFLQAVYTENIFEILMPTWEKGN